MFKPKAIYYEEKVRDYPFGRELLEKYEKMKIPMFVIENHNNIEEIKFRIC